MNLAKISANGQLTVPSEIRRRLGLRNGDKVLFQEGPDGTITITNASAQALEKVQNAFTGLAEKLGVSSEDEVQALIDEVRYGGDRI